MPYFFAIFEKKFIVLLKAITGNYKLRAGCREKDGQKEYYILYFNIIYNKYIYNFLFLSYELVARAL